MAVDFKTNDQIVFTEQVGDLTEGTTGVIKFVKGCSCKPEHQWAIIEVNGVKHDVKKFRSKVSLVNG